MDLSITTQKPEAVNSTFSALPNDGLLYHQIIKYSTGKEIDALRQSDSNFYRWFRDKVQTPLRLPEYRTPGGLSPGRIYAVYRAITELETPQDAYILLPLETWIFDYVG